MKYVLLLLLLTACAVEQEMNHNMPMNHEMPIASEAEFVIEMIPHHQEAVDTAIIIRDSTKNAELKDLTERIITAQEAEISMMNGWVDAWYEPYKPTYMNMMPDLLSLQGEARDNAFLEGMIMHHEMAVQMAEDVLELNPRADVAVFANDVIRVQTDEIAEMRSMLA